MTLRASSTLHNDIFSKMMASPMKFFDTTPVGRIINRFSADLDESKLIFERIYQPILMKFRDVFPVFRLQIDQLSSATIFELFTAFYDMQRVKLNNIEQLSVSSSVAESDHKIRGHFDIIFSFSHFGSSRVILVRRKS